MSMKIGRMFSSGAAAAACLFFAGFAQAGLIFQGDFDPPLYGGTVVVDVDPACVSGGTAWIAVPGCGPVDILSLVVNNNPSQPADQLTFAPPTIFGEVWGLYWVGGVLTAIDTFLISPQVSGPTTGDVFDGFEFAIQFVSNQDGDGNGPSIVNLYKCLDGCGPTLLEFVGDEPATQRGFVQVVPEPASLGLMLGALGAGWLARRRKAKA